MIYNCGWIDEPAAVAYIIFIPKAVDTDRASRKSDCSVLCTSNYNTSALIAGHTHTHTQA